ncbi:MAG: magnesium transporter [Alphaproteobacteria bacterium]
MSDKPAMDLSDDSRPALSPDDRLTPAVIDGINDALKDGDEDVLLRITAGLAPSDMADLVESLEPEDRSRLLSILGPRLDFDVFPELDETLRQELLGDMPAQDVALAVSALDTDEAVEVLEDMHPAAQREVLDAVAPAERRTLEASLAWPEDSAGRLMVPETLSAPHTWTVGDVIDHIRAADRLPERFYDVILLDDDRRPVATIPLHRVLATRRPTPLADIGQDDMKRIPVTMDQEDVAHLFRRYGLVSGPVVDEDGRLLGMITVDDIVDVIDEEANEDLMRLGGVSGSDLYRATMKTTVARGSWLAVNLATAIAASVVIGFFQVAIEQIVALAVLMPIVASMGGNAGIQTMTVVVRAIAMKQLTRANLLRALAKEVTVGLLNGLVFAGLVGVVAIVWFGRVDIGAVIAVSMLLNLIVANLAGILIPVGLERVGADPAAASGVLLTTVTDVLGFLTFLGLAALLLL